ncbi:tRNA (adenine(58)-N(1))-methyltransferase catalytic subunit TRMT61A [Symbiodinium microadriaticum]|uniref:tRNA (adenine(58)-N(1))-methyltransferase n=2 Tax=Symbiodinium TaxID=2949 RepID=A0A1Q9C2L2_SYMMI|nr:tRNA (adenine(58)-N(1))-methyltransferase catalytic subunit TRMT61A [Symbiodinium microadriaticum]
MEGSLRIPEGWADEFRMTVADPRTFQPGQRICFESERPKNDFRIRLLVFPAGQSMDHGQDSRVSVYVELLLPPSATMGNRRWTREDVCVEVAVLYSETGPVSHSRVGWFAATELSQQAGLDDVVYLDDLEECLNEGQLHLCAKASIAPRHCGRREDVEMTLHHSEAHDAVPGQFLRSRRAGLPHNFMFDLQVYPRGRHGRDWDFGVFLELWPGLREQAGWWDAGYVKCQVAVCRGESVPMLRTAYFSFDMDGDCRGWSDVEWLGAWRDGTEASPQTISIRATLEFPLKVDAWHNFVHDVDFTQQPEYVTFHLAEGPPMYFDKRILMTSSEYFEHMLGNAGWKEGQSNEVDLSNEPLADCRVMTAIFHFMLSETFSARGDVVFALFVRRLADRYSLNRLVRRTEDELEDLLSEENILSVLAHVFGSCGRLERTCVDLVKYNKCEVLCRQRDKVFQIVTEHPELGKQLLNMSLNFLEDMSHKPERKLHTFEFHEDRQRQAAADFEKYGFMDVIVSRHRDVCNDGFGEDLRGAVHGIFLDLPAPWAAVGHVLDALVPGGRLVTFSPCVEQVDKTATELRRSCRFFDIRMLETLAVNWGVRAAEAKSKKRRLPNQDADESSRPQEPSTTAKSGPDPGSQWLSYQMPMRSHTAYLLVATRAPADEAVYRRRPRVHDDADTGHGPGADDSPTIHPVKGRQTVRGPPKCPTAAGDASTLGAEHHQLPKIDEAVRVGSGCKVIGAGTRQLTVREAFSGAAVCTLARPVRSEEVKKQIVRSRGIPEPEIRLLAGDRDLFDSEWLTSHEEVLFIRRREEVVAFLAIAKNDPDVGLVVKRRLMQEGRVSALLAWLLSTGLFGADEWIRDDAECVAAVVAVRGLEFQHAAAQLRDNETLATAAVRSNGLALEFASERLQEHLPLVSTAVLQNYRALRFARGALRSEGVVVRNALRNVLATPIAEGQFSDDSDGQLARQEEVNRLRQLQWEELRELCPEYIELIDLARSLQRSALAIPVLLMFCLTWRYDKTGREVILKISSVALREISPVKRRRFLLAFTCTAAWRHVQARD